MAKHMCPSGIQAENASLEGFWDRLSFGHPTVILRSSLAHPSVNLRWTQGSPALERRWTFAERPAASHYPDFKPRRKDRRFTILSVPHIPDKCVNRWKAQMSQSAWIRLTPGLPSQNRIQLPPIATMKYLTTTTPMMSMTLPPRASASCTPCGWGTCRW